MDVSIQTYGYENNRPGAFWEKLNLDFCEKLNLDFEMLDDPKCLFLKPLVSVDEPN